MFEAIAGFITTIATVAAGAVGYVQSRGFVSKRLRYVDQAQSPIAPVVAGVAGVAVAAPIALILPFVTAGTAIVFGLAVAFGTRAGAKRIRRALYP